jgi:beta-galactosidase
MQEVKYNYQNISIEVGEDTFTVKNKSLFTDTGIYDCVVTLQRNGKVIEKRQLVAAVPPLSEAEFALPVSKPGKETDAEDAVTVSFLLREDMLWAKRGYETAFGQKVYPVVHSQETAASAYSLQKKFPEHTGLRIIHGMWNLGVKGADFEVLFSYNTGGLVSYRYRGVELLEKMPEPDFWRAPVENDYGNRMPGRCAQWKIASMYLANRSFGALENKEPEVVEKDKTVSVSFHYYMPTTPESTCRVTYRVFADGTVETTLFYEPVAELADMPEFGMMFRMKADYDRVEWYGMGPEETYADRSRGARLGIYQNHVADNMAQYLVPQECGNKTGVRYAKVTDDRGRGLLFCCNAENGGFAHRDDCSDSGMSFSALPFTPHEIENATHHYELPEVHYTVIRAAMAQLGVGGDDSWGAPVHPEYHIDVTKPLEFTFCFRGI